MNTWFIEKEVPSRYIGKYQSFTGYLSENVAKQVLPYISYKSKYKFNLASMEGNLAFPIELQVLFSFYPGILLRIYTAPHMWLLGGINIKFLLHFFCLF